MAELVPYLKKDKIEKLVKSTAELISSDYKDKNLVLIGVLKGAFVFLSDLMRHLTIPAQIDFIGVSTYGQSDTSSGKIELTKDIKLDIKDKEILIVEDIVDTGYTLTYLADYLKPRSPASIGFCALIDKVERRNTDAAVKLDYVCHVAQKGFLVGYGLDHAENYRNLPEIYHLNL